MPAAIAATNIPLPNLENLLTELTGHLPDPKSNKKNEPTTILTVSGGGSKQHKVKTRH
jgi:hypothetical protein